MKNRDSVRLAVVYALAALAGGLWIAATPAQASDYVLYQRTAIFDPAANVPAAWMLVPNGWAFESSVVWNVQRPACPATIAAHVSDPESGARFQLLPSQFFGWNVGINQPYYLGYEIVPGPQTPFQLFDHYIFPRARTNHGCTNFRVLNRQTVSSETDALGGTRVWARVEVDYHYNGVAWDEVFYGLFTYTPNGQFVSCEVLACFAAPQEALDEYAPTLNMIANSTHMAPGWYTGFRTISDQLVKGFLVRVEEIGDWSETFAREMDQLSDEQFRAWQRRNAAEDRAFRNWSNAFRGVNTYNDGGRHVDLDNTRKAWWTNNLGEYIGTDGHVNPNDWGMNQDWTRLQRVQ